MSQADIQKDWEEKINLAKKARDEWSSQFKVEMARDYFEGKQNPGYPEDEWITVNKVYAHLQAQLPMLYSIDPYFYVKLKRSYSINPKEIAEFEQKGSIRQSMLNYLKGELALKAKARLSIQSAHFAYGAVKTHFKADLKEHPQAGNPVLDEEGSEIKDEDGKTQVYPDEIPENKRYLIDYIDPDDILFDDDAGTLEDSWRWIAQRIVMTMAEAKKDKRFSVAALKTVQTSKKEEQTPFKKMKNAFSGNITTEKPDNEFITTWEIYDLKKKEWLIIAENAKQPLLAPKSLPLGIEGHPFSFLRFVLREKSPYPIPPIYPGLDPQKEYNLSRSRLLTHRKRFNRKYIAIASKFEDPDTELPKLERGDDGTVLKAIANGAVEAINDAPLDQQNIQEIFMLNADMNELLGSPGAARGIADADSATEAAVLDRRMEVKEGDRMSIVIDFIQDVAKKLDQLVQAHIDEDTAVKITGPEGERWEIVKESDYQEINGEFEYSVNIGSTAPRLPDIERSQWIAFLSQVVVPFPHILTAPNVMKRMAEMFHIEDEAALEEFRQLGLKIMQGQVPQPGGGGTPEGGVPNPASAILGAAMGQTGGNVNGGGAPQLTEVQ